MRELSENEKQELYRKLREECQAVGMTTDHTDNLLEEVVGSLLADEDEDEE